MLAIGNSCREGCAAPLFRAGQIGIEALERAAPAAAHAVVSRVEGLPLFGTRIQRRPDQRDLGLAARLLLEGDCREQFERPRRAERMPGDAAGLVRERMLPR